MTVDFQSVNYQADLKLIEFTKKRIAKLEQFYDRIVSVEIFTKLMIGSKQQTSGAQSQSSRRPFYGQKNMQKFRRSWFNGH